MLDAPADLLPPDWLRTHQTLAAALLDYPVTVVTLPRLLVQFGACFAVLSKDLWVEHGLFWQTADTEPPLLD
jgi:hypothetical protein